MHIERFEELISAYGADPDRWPAEERAAMQRIAADHPGANALLARERALDERLDAHVVRHASPPEASILAALPLSPLDRFLDWLLPADGALLRPGLAAASIVAIGIMIGTTTMDNTTTTTDWDDELYLLALDDSGVLP